MDQYFGIELLNDDETPMEAVVNMLRDTLAVSEAVAFERMLRVHQDGQHIVYMGVAADQEIMLSRIDTWQLSNGCPVAYRATGPHSHDDYARWLDDQVIEDHPTPLSRPRLDGAIIAIVLLLLAGVAVQFIF